MKIPTSAASPAPPSSSVVCEQIYEGINEGIEWITKRTAELLSETMMVTTNIPQPAEETKKATSATVTSSLLFSSPSRPQDAVVKERAAVVNMSHNGGVSQKRRRIDKATTTTTADSMAFPPSVGSTDTTTEQTTSSIHSALQNHPRTSSLCDNHNDHDKTNDKPITPSNNKNRSPHFNRSQLHNHLMRRKQKQQRQRLRYRHCHGCEAGLADDADDDTKAKSGQNELGDLEEEVHNINDFFQKRAWMYEHSSHLRRTTAFCCSSGLDPIQEEGEECTINHHESRDDQEGNSYRGWEKSSVEYLQKEPMELDEDQYLNAYDNYSFQQRGIQPKQFRPDSPSKQEVLIAVNDCKNNETNHQFPFEGSCITPTNVADDFMSLWTT